MRKLIIAALAAFAMCFTAVPAHAGNGTSNFYLSASCAPNTSGARLSVTNWDIDAYQQYHVDLNPSYSGSLTVPAYTSHSIRIDGVVVSGGTNDLYKRFYGWGRHRVTGYWTRTLTGERVSCSVTI